jgi:hypothetical protein
MRANDPRRQSRELAIPRRELRSFLGKQHMQWFEFREVAPFFRAVGFLQKSIDLSFTRSQKPVQFLAGDRLIENLLEAAPVRLGAGRGHSVEYQAGSLTAQAPS